MYIRTFTPYTREKKEEIPLSLQRKIASKMAPAPVLIGREMKVSAMMEWLRMRKRFDIGILDDTVKAKELEDAKAKLKSLTDAEFEVMVDEYNSQIEKLSSNEQRTWMSVEAISPDHQTIALKLEGEAPRKVLISMDDFFELSPDLIRFHEPDPPWSLESSYQA